MMLTFVLSKVWCHSMEVDTPGHPEWAAALCRWCGTGSPLRGFATSAGCHRERGRDGGGCGGEERQGDQVDLQIDPEEDMELDGEEHGDEEMEVDVEEEREEEMEVDGEENTEEEMEVDVVEERDERWK
ncbi:hypothetical protein DUI87_21578 [Hirundo rustica rustica]|uniref:Uncharacterized protein n=1 Tax=Hirundo rustica rustica TaxID=333673 RepID=A0A3M0JMY5_HIRRU|nr:hypothetical protein DUI87_21578 [Hirundo rustica rustica]